MFKQRKAKSKQICVAADALEYKTKTNQQFPAKEFMAGVDKIDIQKKVESYFTHSDG